VHARQLPPLLAEGPDRTLFPTTQPLSFAALAESAADEIKVVLDSEIPAPTTANMAGNVGEPSVAVNGKVVLFTGNWYAGISTDGGKTFKMSNPFKDLSKPSDPANLVFCCDQVAHYIPKIDMFVWLLQYGTPTKTNNLQRIAFANTVDAVAGKWRTFDINNASLGLKDRFLDYPDMAVAANHLYITTNIFPAPGLVQGFGAAVIRIPLESIRTGTIKADRFVSPQMSFRVAQNCGTTAFFATQEDTATLRVFSWDEKKAAPTSVLVPVSRFLGNAPYQSRTPDGRRWLDRIDARITGATMAGNELWFAWSVDRGSNRRPKPFVQIARIDSTTMKNIEDINIFDNDSATAYAALGTNSKGEVGICYWIGGGERFPTLAVGVLTGNRRDKLVAVSERGPVPNAEGKHNWGDYCAVRPVFPDGKLFGASGYTLKGKKDSTPPQNATPRLVIFGRTGDVT
jgi:hypothetical protein